MTGESYTARIRRGDVDPYVGEGADGARRSARIISDELAALGWWDSRRGHLEAVKRAWEDRALVLEAEETRR